MNSVWHRTPLVSPWTRHMGYGGAEECDTIDLSNGPDTADDNAFGDQPLIGDGHGISRDVESLSELASGRQSLARAEPAIDDRFEQLFVPSQGSNLLQVIDTGTLDLLSSLSIPATHGAGMMVARNRFYTTNISGGGIAALFPIDTTTVGCTASDKSGNSTPASFDVVVRGAAEQLANLSAAVAAAPEIGNRNRRFLQIALLTSLAAAESAVAEGDTPAL